MALKDKNLSIDIKQRSPTLMSHTENAKEEEKFDSERALIELSPEKVKWNSVMSKIKAIKRNSLNKRR